MTPVQSELAELTRLSNAALNRAAAVERRELGAAFLALAAVCRLANEGWTDLADFARTVVRVDDLEERLARVAHHLERVKPSLRVSVSTILTSNLRHLNPSPLILILTVDGAASIIQRAKPAAFSEWISATIEATAPVTAGPWLTPRHLAELMAKVVGDTPTKAIFDPFCRSGELLEAAFRFQQAPGLRSHGVGATQSPLDAALARLRFFFLDVGVDILEIDALREPFVEKGQLRTFDKIICDVPFGRRLSAHDLGHRTPWRWMPREGRGVALESAYLRLAHTVLARDGRAVLRTPLGVLFRGGTDSELRQLLLEDDLIAGVVRLPSGLVPGSAIESALVILDRAKSPNTRDKVLMVDLSSLSPHLDDWSERAFREMREAACCESGRGRWVAREEIAGQHFVLLPSRYLGGESTSEAPLADVDQLEQARALEAEAEALAREYDERVNAWFDRAGSAHGRRSDLEKY